VILPITMVAVCLIACSASQRADTLRGTLIAVNAARDGFVAWDRQHQNQLVGKANSQQEAEQWLDDYRAKRTPVINTFEVVYRALALAATQTDQPSLIAALNTSADLIEAINKLRGGN
jgi:hypothetical protein